MSQWMYHGHITMELKNSVYSSSLLYMKNAGHVFESAQSYSHLKIYSGEANHILPLLF